MGKSDENVALVVTSGLFVLSAVWFVRKKWWQEENAVRNQPNVQVPKELSGRVGSRGLAALSPPIPYLHDFFLCLADPCEPKTNPEGYIALCVAENKLIMDVFAQRIIQVGTINATFSDPAVYGYDNFLGLPSAREAVAYFLTRRFLIPDDPSAEGQSVKPEHVALASGCASILNSLFFLLAEPGDCVLIPAPYYAAFESDMRVIARCRPFAVKQSNPARGPSVQELTDATQRARAQGLKPKILLLTNPNNPLGTIYPPEVIASAIEWARKHKMHTMVDEVYGLSTHKGLNHGFQSVMKIMDNKLGDDVHFLWALSKDFGASGFRLGVVYTQNELLLYALGNLNIFSAVSHPVQAIAADILTDDAFVDMFLDTARERLFRSYMICTAKLEEMVIPFVQAEAGLFVYADFSSLLPEPTFEGEAELASLITSHARVVLTPGSSQRDTKPGMFRFCYAWNSPEVLTIAMERLGRLVAKIRKMDWSDVKNPKTIKGVIDA